MSISGEQPIRIAKFWGLKRFAVCTFRDSLANALNRGSNSLQRRRL